MTPRRPSARTREEAILICAVASDRGRCQLYVEITEDLRFDRTAYALAIRAVEAVTAACGDWPTEDGPWLIDAEAAALLAEGWTPGDKLRVLR